MKRFLSLLLTAALLATCFSMAGAMAEEEKYTYKILTFQSGVLDDEPYMLKYWNERFNVNFEVEVVEQSAVDELIPIRLAGGEFPDILNWYRNDYLRLASEGLVGGLSVEMLQKYAPLIYEEMSSYEGLIEYCSYDGKLFTLGHAPELAKYPSMSVWRTAWLDAIGEEMPATLEDAERVWYAFAKNDPDGNGLDDTYGLSKGGMEQVYCAYGLYTDWIKDENGQLINSRVSPRRREALEKLAQYYADGVLDPEFITGENNGGYWGVSHAFTNGRIGYTQHGNYSHWPLTYSATTAESFANAGAMFQAFPDEVTETAMPYQYAKPLVGPYGDKYSGASNYAVLYSFSSDLTQDEPRMGRLLEIAEVVGGYHDPEDYINLRYGMKGVHWDYDEEGFPVSFEGYDTVASRVAIGALTVFQFAISDAGNLALASKASLHALDVTASLGHVGGQVYVTGILPSAVDYQAELDKLYTEVSMDIITGVKDITAFDEMVETWYAIGGDILTEEANELYNK